MFFSDIELAAQVHIKVDVLGIFPYLELSDFLFGKFDLFAEQKPHPEIFFCATI